MPLRRTVRLPLHSATPIRPARRKTRKTGNLNMADCPTRTVLDHVVSRWGSLVLVMLLDRTHRFSELTRRIGGVSEKMLAQTLHGLETDGFVLRTVYLTKPPKVEYSLTPMGSELAGHVKVLTSWIEGNVTEVLAHRAKTVHA